MLNRYLIDRPSWLEWNLDKFILQFHSLDWIQKVFWRITEVYARTNLSTQIHNKVFIPIVKKMCPKTFCSSSANFQSVIRAACVLLSSCSWWEPRKILWVSLVGTWRRNSWGLSLPLPQTAIWYQVCNESIYTKKRALCMVIEICMCKCGKCMLMELIL